MKLATAGDIGPEKLIALANSFGCELAVRELKDGSALNDSLREVVSGSHRAGVEVTEVRGSLPGGGQVRALLLLYP